MFQIVDLLLFLKRNLDLLNFNYSSNCKTLSPFFPNLFCK